MKLSIIKSYGVETEFLPNDVFGSFWLEYKDSDFNTQKLINITAKEGKWEIQSDYDIAIIHNNEYLQTAYLELYNHYFLKINGEENLICIYCSPILQGILPEFNITDNSVVTVGKNSDNIITVTNVIPDKFFTLEYKNGTWFLTHLSSEAVLYVNNMPASKNKLEYGDVLFLMGTKIILMKDFIIVDSAPGSIQIKGLMFSNKNAEYLDKNFEEEKISPEINLYRKQDYFHPSPRLRNSFSKFSIKIDPPPAKEKNEAMSTLLTIGPMLTMGLVTVMTGFNSISGLLNGTKTLKETFPALIITGAMIMSIVFFPMMTKAFQAASKTRKEFRRKSKYRKYLDEKKAIIKNNADIQAQALLTNYISFEECKNIIINKPSTIWSRRIGDSDFLELRLGLGNAELDCDINFPQESFTVDDDKLRDMMYEVISDVQELKNVPITIKLTAKNLLALIGHLNLSYQLSASMIAQTFTHYSYENIKIVVFTSEKNKNNWQYLKKSPHNWDNDKNIRFFASNSDDAREISEYLNSILHHRRYKKTSTGLEYNDADYRSYRPYYLVFTDNYKNVRDFDFFKSMIEPGINVGFSLVILDEKISSLPNECENFVYVDSNLSGIMANELNEELQDKFNADFANIDDMESLCSHLANIPIEFEEKDGALPEVLGFLEMYEAGMIDYLNITKRWQESNPIKSLKAAVGVNKSGDLFYLDLHEKFHGPHGLIAGGTGSGKSEFIITYILSMAVNYHPHEVSFVLIDYKGGGLAGVFENREKNISLPHLAGTITNLDIVEMNRALASIQSELRKRQEIFNQTRDALGESSIDIYKYQRFYREGKVDKPLPHLCIISDEFAELKMQQPEFMEQLISTARIGRSLGVHLVLATQKPSGVVDDQIWSNAKFRVCMKVQEKADSIDMIKVPDAADIKTVGRFYLQVGYNDFFDIGQSAWSGATYMPVTKIEKNVDNSLILINDIGNILYQADDKSMNTNGNGEEVTNIVKYIIDIAAKENVKSEKLWLDRIPAEIFVEKLKEKYTYDFLKMVINPIIGEYDDPYNQTQNLLTLNLSDEGNTLIYGSSGSGKENLITTIVYSTIIDHSADEVNFYLLDFGSESLKAFANAPQVADVVYSYDSEKIENLFKLLVDEIETRKELLIDYNGSISAYCESTGNKMPFKIVIINGYENFMENYEKYENVLISLSRDGLRYGVIFIISASGSNAIRYRLLQNFKKQLVLQFNDFSDYSAILGNIGSKRLTNFIGRGFVKLNDIYEFQTAYPYSPDNLNSYLKIICDKLKEASTEFAKPIPILPKTVSLFTFDNEVYELSNIPIGIYKDTLAPATYDFINNFATLISVKDMEDAYSFSCEFYKMIGKCNSTSMYLIDAEEIIDNFDSHFGTYVRSNMETFATSILNEINKQLENQSLVDNTKKYRNNCFIIIGFEKFIKEIEKTISIEEFFKKSREWKQISFIAIDEANKFKSLEYESWYKEIFNPENGIWIGEGLNDQYTIKTNSQIRSGEELNNTFGYIVKKGKPKLIKLLGGEHE